jgi:hypothetical protein
VKRYAPAAAAALVLVAAALAPLPVRPDRAARSPRSAAALAEAAIPPLGVGWGKVRGWERAGEGWRIVWQPSHGAWLLRAWVPDGAGQAVGWWLDAAPWLPGARLSRAAAILVAGGGRGTPVPFEKLARRDWLVGEDRVVGALPAGRRVPAPSGPDGDVVWGAVLAGLVFAGALGRVLIPVVVAPGWRRLAGWTAAIAVVALPLMTPLASRRFEVGVRPWVSEAIFGATVAMALLAVAVAAVRYPAGRGRAAGPVLAAALAAGLLAGRLQPVPWCAEMAGLEVRAVAWLAVALLGGWLAADAGEGLRQLLAPARASRALLVALGGAMVLSAGAWLGAAVAILGAAAGGRGQGTPVASLTLWGWVVGATWATCAWSGALRDSLLMLLVGAALVIAAALADHRHAV